MYRVALILLNFNAKVSSLIIFPLMPELKYYLYYFDMKANDIKG